MQLKWWVKNFVLKLCKVCGMGNNVKSKSFLLVGQGLRILSIKLNSPFDGKVEPFFDFIIDVVPLEHQISPKQILNKLASSQLKALTPVKDFQEIVRENEDRKLQIKIVSTKHRNVRSFTVTPNRNWNGSKDLIGINVRKQKYDEVFDTYFPVAQIQKNSPIQLAGIKQGQFLIGCLQFPYFSINMFIEGLYDRFFDKQVPDKRIHLAFYNILEDEVSVKPVLLKRDWGVNGILGCKFLQGQIYKFPNNLNQRRQSLLQQQKMKNEKEKIKMEIQECDGASRTLSQALKKKRSKKGRQMQRLKQSMGFELKHGNQVIEGFRCEEQEKEKKVQEQKCQKDKLEQIKEQEKKIKLLENKILHLEETLINVRKYLDNISQGQGRKEEQIKERIL